MKSNINIAVVGLVQVGIYLLNELNTKKKKSNLKKEKKLMKKKNFLKKLIKKNLLSW